MNLQLVYSGLGVPANVAITGSYYVRLDAPSSDTVLYVREGGLWWPMASVDSATNYTDAVALTTLASALTALDGFGALRVVEIPTALAATTDSLLTLPAGAIIYKAQFVIDTSYTVGTVVTMGQPGFASIFVANTDIFTADTTAGDIYIKEQATPASAVAVVRVTLSGGPAVGAGRAQIFFAVPEV